MAVRDTEAIKTHLPPIVWKVVRLLSKIMPILIFFLFWEIASGRLVTADLLPPFSAAFTEALNLAVAPDSNLPSYLFATVYRSLVGILVAISLGVPIGLAMGRNEWVQRQLDPIISITYPAPKSPLIPIIIFWLGVGDLPRIFLAVIGALLPIVLSTFNGVQDIDEEMLWSARSMGLNRIQETFKIVVPATLPSIITGVRIGMIFSFVIVISSEMIVSGSGLGVLIIEFGQFALYPRVFGVVLWIILVVAGADRLLVYFANRWLLNWSEQGVGGV